MATISSTIELVDKMSSKLKTIEDNIGSMKKTLKSVSDEQSSIDSFSWNTFLTNAEHAGEKMVSIGKKISLAITSPLLLLGKRMYGNAVDYESAFAGVTKTTTATEEEYQALYNDLLLISETNPTGFVDAAGIMEMAGQLGVAKEELTGFTEAYIGLQESTNILGEEGAEELARFLNVTEKTTDNIKRIGGVIVGLGNNNATTEREILSMATRIGATGDLAGFSAKEILGLSAALSSVGINAEAGGSAAGKLMKKMQLAAEVGGQAQEKIAGIHWMEKDKETGKITEVWLKDFAHNGLELVNYLDTLKSADKVDIASQLGMTVDSLQNMADSWLLFDQFSEVMGISGADFLKGWNEAPAQSMLAFFQGLGNLDPEKGNSVLAQLAEMDITEIRLSNLVAAMAGNSDILQAALDEAYRQYDMDTGSNAMAEEVAKRYETQESQNKMLANKFDNTMADFGTNLAEALQPALDLLNKMLDAFNSLSEADQTKAVKALMGIAVLGPGLSAVGFAVKTIANALKLANQFGGGAKKAIGGLAEQAADSGILKKATGKQIAEKVGGAITNPIVFGATVAVTTLTGMQNLENSVAERRWASEEETAVTVAATAAEAGAERISEAYNIIKEARDTLRNNTIDEELINQLTGNEAFQQAAELAGFGNTNWLEQWQLGGWASLIGGTGDTGIFGTMLDNLEEQVLDAAEAGANVSSGLADGMTQNADVANNAASALGADVISAADAALGVNSPSTFMIAAGLNLDQGLMIGINSGSGMVVAAASALGARVLASLKNALGVHSPSTETYWQGEMMIAGYVNALHDGESDLAYAASKAVENVWDTISMYSGLEAQALTDEFNHVSDGIKVNDADIKKIRDLAEREVINRFTTAEIRVEMNNTNNINSDMDLDGIISKLEDTVAERLEAVAEGVYN